MSVELTSIRNLKKVAGKSGSIGELYLAPKGSLDPRDPMAVKRYKSGVVAGKERAVENHLTMLVDMGRKFWGKPHQDVPEQGIVWPEDLVYDKGTICGYTMPYIPETFRVRYQGMTGEVVADSTLGFALQDDETRRTHRLPLIDKLGRAVISYQLLQTLAWLHQHDLVAGDISPNNIFVRIDTRPLNDRVLFLDADSFRQVGTVSPLGQTHTNGWIPPECLAARGTDRYFAQDKATDVYKICLAILRLYHLGDHRTAVLRSPRAEALIASEVGADFSRCVMLGLNDDPRNRPSCAQLLQVLAGCLKSAR